MGSGENLDAAPLLIALVVVVFLLFAFFRSQNRDWEDDGEQVATWDRPPVTAAAEEAARTAAAEAAVDDVAFDADAVLADARSLFAATQAAWDAGDRAAMARLLGPDLFEEWCLRLDDFDAKGWYSRVVVQGAPEARLIGLVNRTGDEADRVVVFVSCPIQAWVTTADGTALFRDGEDGPDIVLQQYWTLGRHDGRWILLSIEEEREGRHHLQSDLIPVPWADPDLAGQARTELAVADAAGPAAEVARLSSTAFSHDARAAALDLSLVDDRFSPDVLTVAVEAVVHAWTEAVDGDDAALRRRAAPAAVDVLLYGGDATRTVRTVVRGLEVEAVTIESLDGHRSPPAMAVVVAYRGARYREHRWTQEVTDGSRDRVVSRQERWTLGLTDDPEVPWVVIQAQGAR